MDRKEHSSCDHILSEMKYCTVMSMSSITKSLVYEICCQQRMFSKASCNLNFEWFWAQISISNEKEKLTIVEFIFHNYHYIHFILWMKQIRPMLHAVIKNLGLLLAVVEQISQHNCQDKKNPKKPDNKNGI